MSDGVDTTNVITTTVLPAIGTVLSNVISLSSYPSMATAIRNGNLGRLNIKNYPIQVVNASGWLLYSLVLRDWYVFWSNALGVMLTLYYCFWAFRLAEKKEARMLLFILYAGGFVNMTLLALNMVFPASTMEQVVGIISDIWAIGVYAGGLTSVREVISTKNSVSIDWRLLVALTANGTMWVGYGLAIGKIPIVFPNLIGFFLCGIQFYLLFKYPRIKVEQQSPKNGMDVLSEEGITSHEMQEKAKLLGGKN